MRMWREESGKDGRSESAESQGLKRKLHVLLDEGLEVLEAYLEFVEVGSSKEIIQIKDEEGEDEDVL